MNPIKPLLGTLTILVTLAFLTGGCEKSPTATQASPSTNNYFNKPLQTAQEAPPPIQAEPFHGQVYKSLNGRTVLTLVSKDECEIAENGATLLCKYTKQDGKLRVVTTAFGTSQVLYFLITDQGLDDNKGGVLLTQEKYTAAVEQAQREKERVAEVELNSKRETQVTSTHSLSPYNHGADKLVLTDVSLKLHYPASSESYEYTAEKNALMNFAEVGRVSDVVQWKPDVYWFFVNQQPIACKSEAEAKIVHDAVLNAYNAWKAKFR